MTHDRPQQAYDVRWNRAGEATLLVRGLEAFQVNETSAFIWSRCDGQTSTGEIASQLAAACGVEMKTASDAVERFLRLARSSRLLEQ